MGLGDNPCWCDRAASGQCLHRRLFRPSGSARWDLRQPFSCSSYFDPRILKTMNKFSQWIEAISAIALVDEADPVAQAIVVSARAP
jgi:hypothetical protein